MYVPIVYGFLPEINVFVLQITLNVCELSLFSSLFPSKTCKQRQLCSQYAVTENINSQRIQIGECVGP